VKPHKIDKGLVVKAWKRVKASRGSAGVDNVSIKIFESNLENNLYKIWNRMSAGTYFPPPVKLVEIPKSDGKVRKLGIPTVGDRVSQMVAKLSLEPKLEPTFHKDSYGYRPGKSAHDALSKTRERCWQTDWVIDMDIKGFFDNLDHELVLKALSKHTDLVWIKLYVKRWLEAPTQVGNEVSANRKMGTPQGGVISPLLANLFMHYTFDAWMEREFPTILFERYADDVVIHVVSESQAKYILNRVRARMKECKLELHPEKTKIVYCKDGKRSGHYENIEFDFLGYTFRRRSAKGKYGLFLSFLPAISNKATNRIREEIRSWKLSSMTHLTLDDIGQKINSKVRGWMGYYGKFFKSVFLKTILLVKNSIVRWAIRKYKSLKRKPSKARRWLAKITRRDPSVLTVTF
jgi:RNA-directed DNA polymerase